MESCDSGVTSPVLRVTTDISELKGKPVSREGGKYSISPSVASRDGKSILFSKRKSLHPLYGHNPYQRSTYAGSYISSQQNPKNNVSSFTQRVMSAKLLRVKQLQNQLAETQMKLNDVLNENKTLKTLQHRQDSVLKKYEGHQEQLPQLLKSHHEEIRILTEKYKQLRSSYRELENRMKQKDSELTSLREQYKHLLKLSRDKQLGEREKLAKKVEEMESIIEQQKNKIFSLDKKLAIDEKNHRFQLNQEISKNKKIQSELNSALETINNLKSTIEAKERFASASYPRFQQSAPTSTKAVVSHISLPAPPRVSIRQTHRLVQSDSALQQEDSETAESFTVNYSPGEQGSSSMDSDNMSTHSKEDGTNNRSLRQQFKENEGLRVSSMIPGSVHLSKEAFKERRARRKSMEKEQDGVSEKPVGKVQISSRRKSIKSSSTKETIDSKHDTIAERKPSKALVNISNAKSLEENYIQNTTVSKQENTSLTEGIVVQSKENGEQDKIINSKTKEMGTQEVVTISNMRLDIDDEFEKFLEETKLSDEAITEYFKRDFREEILEIEQKFQDLNKASERYMDTGKSMNGISSHIPLAAESSDSDEEVADNKKVNGELEDLARMRSHSEKQTLLNGPALDDSKKADLLKALSYIEETTKQPGIENDKDTSSSSSMIFKNTGNSSNLPKSSFSRTKRKTEVMKDLFGSDGTKI